MPKNEESLFSEKNVKARREARVKTAEALASSITFRKMMSDYKSRQTVRKLSYNTGNFYSMLQDLIFRDGLRYRQIMGIIAEHKSSAGDAWSCMKTVIQGLVENEWMAMVSGSGQPSHARYLIWYGLLANNAVA